MAERNYDGEDLRNIVGSKSLDEFGLGELVSHAIFLSIKKNALEISLRYHKGSEIKPDDYSFITAIDDHLKNIYEELNMREERYRQG